MDTKEIIKILGFEFLLVIPPLMSDLSTVGFQISNEILLPRKPRDRRPYRPSDFCAGVSLNLIFEYFQKYFLKSHFSLKSGKNNGYFT